MFHSFFLSLLFLSGKAEENNEKQDPFALRQRNIAVSVKPAIFFDFYRDAALSLGMIFSFLKYTYCT